MVEEMDQEILAEFITETVETLDALDPQFIALEKSPEDIDVLNSIFRAMHSIKGASAFFNLTHIRNFAHKLENLLDELRKGTRKATKEIINILLVGKDHLLDMLNRLAEGDATTQFSAEEEALLEKVKATLETEDKQRLKPRQLFTKIDKLRETMETAGLMEKEPVVALLEVIEQLREAVLGGDGADDKVAPLGKVLVGKGLVTNEDVVEALSHQKKIGDLLVEEGKVTQQAIDEAVTEQRKQAGELAEAKRAKPVKPTGAMTPIKKTMRIEEDKIDGFMDAVGELIINSEVFNYLQKKIETGQNLTKLKTEFKNANVEFNEQIFNLQKELAEVRKVPIKGIFQKLPRMARDLAQSTGKQVDLEISGDGLLVDKSLFEQLESPINHLMRNAVDHGVETPDKRAQSGKDPVGAVKVTAEEISGDLVIHIIDDGKGMNAETLKAKAIEKGIITQPAANAMADKDAYKLIFAPGFSTAEKVTDVSGRGVGMDVVMTAIKENKGRIDINTEEGKGCDFIISMPMATTLITISGLVVSVGKEYYIVPMEWVRESLHPDRSDVSSVKGKGEIIRIRDIIYPLVRLHEIFDVEPNYHNPWEAVVMVIEKEDQRFCLMVDEIVEETQVVLKDLGEMFREVDGILGGSILGDGKVGLVINIEGIMSANNKRFVN